MEQLCNVMCKKGELRNDGTDKRQGLPLQGVR